MLVNQSQILEHIAIEGSRYANLGTLEALNSMIGSSPGSIVDRDRSWDEGNAGLGVQTSISTTI